MTATCARTKRVLVIAGLDPSGGAGLVADIQTLALSDCRSGALATTLTAQGLNRWVDQHPVDPSLLAQQAQALQDGPPWDAVKIGALGSGAVTEVVARLLQDLKAAQPALRVVLDPVLRSSSGGALGAADALPGLLPWLDVITPNRAEWAALSERMSVSTLHVLITDAQAPVSAPASELSRNDAMHLWQGATQVAVFPYRRHPSTWRGTGCRLSSRLAARLAHGDDIPTAVADALDWVQQRIGNARGQPPLSAGSLL
ncbi:MAG: bifunctional hydroxymethylpyrimidine kinase/phosphomethylpyrimidine kinase [Oceanococcaceae bacterium]